MRDLRDADAVTAADVELIPDGYSRRDFVRNVGAVGAAMVLGACTSPDRTTSPKSATGSQNRSGLPPIEGAQVITDRSKFPTVFRESPEFAALTGAQKLPPVADRVSADPLVLKPLHGIGRYGGQIRRGFIGQADWVNAYRFCAGPDSLLYWDYKADQVIGNIARDYELSDSDRVLTLFLRRGMKWSDGHPFTADDVIFWREDVSLHKDLAGGLGIMQVDGKEIAVEKVDNLTVRFVSPAPNPLLPQLLAGWSDIAGPAASGHTGGGGFLPKHYLSRFHPKYSSQAEVDRLAAEARFNGWVAYFHERSSWHLNPELPTVAPWKLTHPINQAPWEFAANPYSIWVDVEGNQLPYISKITMSDSGNPEVLGLRAAAGEYDFQDRHLGVTNLPVLMDSQQKSGYTVYRAPYTEMEAGIRLNLAYNEDREIGELIRNVDFRRALSLGIDRAEINEVFFLGTSIPSATMAAADSPYFPGQEWRMKWATHDPAQANSLLDKIGLTAKDGAGYRLRRDGGGRIRLDYQVLPAFVDFVGLGEMVKRQWQQIGIDVAVQQVEGNLVLQRTLSNKLVLSCHGVGTEDPFLRADGFLPTVTNNYVGMIGIPYAQWFASGGRKGTEPPESLRLLKDAMDLYHRGLQASEQERVRLGQELFKLHADQVWSIGLVGFGIAVYGVYLASNKLRNVPKRVNNSLRQKNPSNAHPMTFFYA